MRARSKGSGSTLKNGASDSRLKNWYGIFHVSLFSWFFAISQVTLGFNM